MENNFGYLPWEQRVPDLQYQNLLREILENGEIHKPIHGEETKRITGYLMRFKRKNGFTMTPTRDLLKYNLLQGAMGENIGFMNGARTLTELANYGCPESFWKRWVTAEKCAKFGLTEGDLGPGSYGAAWATFPKPDGTTFNQIEGMIRQMLEVPMLRTILIDPWIPFYTVSNDPKNPRSVVVAPCHGWVHIHIDTVNKTFKLEHKQRSADASVGLQFNMIQYFGMGLMTERVTGYHFDELIYYISDAHIYESQYEHVKRLIDCEPKKYPIVYLAEQAPTDNIFAFRPKDFIVIEYEPNPWFSIPTPI